MGRKISSNENDINKIRNLEEGGGSLDSDLLRALNFSPSSPPITKTLF